MSSPGRLLVLSGRAGSGVTTIARALARSHAAELVSHHEGDPRADRWLDAAGAGLADEELAAVGGLRPTAELRRISAALASGRTVVWDAGPQAWQSLGALMALDVLLPRLDAALRPALLELAADLRPMEDAIPGAWIGHVVGANSTATESVQDAIAAAGLLGLAVDCVVVTMVPERDGGWPRAWAKRRRAHARRARRAARDRAIEAIRVPMLADEPVRPRALRAYLRAIDIERRTLRPGPGRVEPDGDDFAWDLPVGSAAERDLRLGISGGEVVLELDGLVRWLPQPAVMSRCHIVSGLVVGEQVRLRGVRDDSRWRVRA